MKGAFAGFIWSVDPLCVVMGMFLLHVTACMELDLLQAKRSGVEWEGLWRAQAEAGRR